MKDSWLYISLLGFTLGIFLRSIFAIDFYTTCFLLALSLLILLISSFTRTEPGRKNILIGTLLLLTFSLGVLRFDVSDYKPAELSRGGEEISFKGIVVDEPDVREDHSKLTVKIESAKNGDGENLIGNVLVITDRYTTLTYGDEIVITGKIRRPENFVSKESGGGKETAQESFDYVSYLAKDGIYYQMIRPSMEKMGEGKGNPIKAILFQIKHSFLSNINRVIPEPESSLLAGLVVGAKQSLGKELLDDFRVVGVIHIVVLSGYNLTIVAQAMMRVSSVLPQMVSLSIGGLGIVFFAIMTGGSATIIRASIMALLVLLAQGIRRDYDITRALLLAGFFMVMQNPHILVFDPSFQLSFLATIALIYLAPYLKKYFTFIPERFGLQELAISTMATQIFVLPLLLYSMGTLSLVALPVNLLILPLIPMTMFFGFVVGMVGFVSSLVALPFTFITHLLLWYELKVVEIFAALPFASISISYFPLWLMALVYIGFTVFFLCKSTGEVKNTK